MIKKILLFIFLIFFSQIVFSQTGNVRGFVYDKATGEPVLFTPVFLKGTSYGVQTDVNGYYSITRIPPGDYQLMALGIGYDTMQVDISIKADQIVSKQLYLKKVAVNLKTVEVSGERERRKTEVGISVNKITPREIKMMPSIGGEADLAQYLQVLPGVVFSGDQGGQLYIRGGTPVMNKVLLDGMIIYNPFHSIGLFSIFDPDVIRNADVYTGGFGAQYGDRISSVMDVTTRDGNKKRFAGKVSATTFNSKFLIEGPIKKQKESGGGSASFFLTARNSYLNQTSPKFYSYIDKKGLPYSFTDVYSKISLNGENGSKVSFFGFHNQDNADYRFVSSLHWKSSGGGFNFVVVPGGSANLIDGSFSYSDYKITQQEADEKPRYSYINGFNLGINFTGFINKDEVKYGFEILGFRTEFQTHNITGAAVGDIENTTEFGGFLKYRIVRKHFVIDPSLRLHFFASLAEISPEPRLGIKVNITDYLRIKIAGGYYAQNLLSTSSDRDVVNLFYGFLSGPETLPDEFNGKKVTTRLQKAKDVIAGFEINILPHLDLNLESYYKKFIQLTNINRDKIYPDDGTYHDKPDYLVKDFIVENGKSYGADAVLKYDHKRLYLWLVYSLGYVTRNDGVREYVPHFDRRHTANIVASYTLGKKLDWELNARWNYGSGFPFTKTAGYYEYQNFSGGLQTDYVNSNGYLGIIYGDLNAGRLPDYHRLDLSLKKAFYIGKNSSLDATLSVINVYNRENIFYFDRVRYKRVNQLPTLPSVGLSLTF